MTDIVHITPAFAIGPQPEAADFDRFAAAGFKSVINARPDDEIGEYLLSDAARPLARAAGLDYAFTPTEGHEIFETEIIDAFEKALAEMPAPIFAHCKSGTRAAMLWALVAARHRDVEEVIEILRDAGQELDFLEQEMRDSAADAERSPLRLKPDALMNLGTSHLFGGTGRPEADGG